MKNIKRFIVERLGGYLIEDLRGPISISLRTKLGESPIVKKVRNDKRHSKGNTVEAVVLYKKGLYLGEIPVEKEI